MMKQCPNCGAPITKGEAFCGYCGSPVPAGKKKGLIIGACGLLVLIVLAVLLITGVFRKDEPLTVETDGSYRMTGSGEGVIFRAALGENAEPAWLCDEDGNPLGRLHDDGIDGDETAKDGIYTYVLQPGPIEADPQDGGQSGFDWLESMAADASKGYRGTNLVRTRSYVVRCGDQESEPIKVSSFKQPTTDEEKQALREYCEAVGEEIEKIEQKYLNPEGVIPSGKEEAYADEVERLIAKHQEDGGILHYERQDCYIYIKFTSGITRIVEPLQANVSSGGTETELNIWTYQPNPDISLDNLHEYMEQVDDSLENCCYIRQFSDTNVTLDAIKQLPARSVIYWNGHGGYGPIVKSSLCSGVAFDWNAWWWDPVYFADCVADRIIMRSTENQKDMACVTAEFIKHYCGDLTDSLILLGSCHGVQNDKLANAFLNKGAVSVLGFTESVYVGYSLNICINTMIKMTEINKETDDFYTLEDALEAEKGVFGNNDREWGNQYNYYKDNVAAPKIVGAKDYQLSAMRTLTIGAFDLNSEPITEGVNLTVTGEDGKTYEAKPAGDGKYTVRVPIGDYTVTGSKKNYIEAKEQVKVTEDCEVMLFLTQKLSGTYKGWYVATQGKTGVTLEILSDDSGIFNFYNLPGQTNAKNGSYKVKIAYDNGQVIITGEEWIERPSTYNFVTFYGWVHDGGDTFIGTVNSGNGWEFETTRQ